MAPSIHWTILGAGAIGCLWASYLSILPNTTGCTLLKRPGSLTQPMTSHVKLYYHDTCQQSVKVNLLPSDQIIQSIQYLIIAVKAYDLVEAIHQIKYAIHPQATVLVLMNGMPGKQIATLLPTVDLWLGSLSDGACLSAPLQVHHMGVGKTWIGPYKPKKNAILNLPPMALKIEFCDNISPYLWSKLGINSIINGLSVIYQCKNGDLLTDPIKLNRVRLLAQEIDSLLETLGMPHQIDMYTKTRNVIMKTAHNISSTLQDFRRNDRTELSWINGFLVKKARQHRLILIQHINLIQELKVMGITFA